MEHQGKLTGTGIVKCLYIAALLLGCHYQGQAKKISDSSKQKQVSSMEYGKWNFEPAMYYGILHPHYSGAKQKAWIFDFSFHEDKSDVKRLMWIRSENQGLEYWRNERMKVELDSLTPIVNEEIYQATDRLVDLHYADYKDEFSRLQDVIQQCVTYSFERSRGKAQPVIEEILTQNQIICDNIAYIRKTGPGAEMENASRQEGYENALKNMKALASLCWNLVLTTTNLYPPK